MAEAIAVPKREPTELYGYRDQVVALADRMRSMIPGASAAPNETIWKAAQIAHLHKLDPFSGDIYVYPAYRGCSDEEWIVDIGVAAWRRAAQRQAKYHALHEVLAEAETNERIGENYTPGDVGVKYTLYRLDVARECKELDIPYEPVVSFGFFRQKARYIKSKNAWIPDQLANTETRQDKATKRAEKKALKVAFSLDYADEVATRNTTDRWAIVSELDERVKSEERHRQPVMRREPVREEDGDLIFA